VDVAEYLLEQGVDVNATDGTQQFYTPIHAACRSGHLNLMQILIQKGADIFAVDGAGESLLHIASEFGHLDIIKYLFGLGFNVNQSSMIHTPIIAASEGGHIEVVKLLLSNGANVNLTPEGRKDTALHVSAQKGFIEIVKLLLENKADPNSINGNGKTPKEIATPDVLNVF